MRKHKGFEELKEELGDKYDKFMYDMNLELVKQKEEALDKIQYIIAFGFDYDGFGTVDSLKGLVDLLVDYAKQAKRILNGTNKKDG